MNERVPFEKSIGENGYGARFIEESGDVLGHVLSMAGAVCVICKECNIRNEKLREISHFMQTCVE